MALITGRDASLMIQGTAIKVKEWRVTYTNKVKASATSKSSGWEETAKGISSWRGTFHVSMEDGKMAALGTALPGDKVSFIGYSEATNTYSASGNIRLGEFEEAVPIDGDELFIPVNFTGDGALTLV
jgi:hypothetical protein